MTRARTRIRTDFPGANGTDVEWMDSHTLRFAADCKGGPFSMWFRFTVERPECDVLLCELCHGETALGWPYKPWVRPVFRAAGRRWERVAATEVDATAGTMRFGVPCVRRTTEIAFCHPYQPADWQRFYERALASAGARVVEIGVSERGQALFAYECGSGPVEILLTARHHSGETPGAYALEGAFAALIAAGGCGLTVRAIPFIDMDGVVEGMYGKERPPVDFNRAWSGAQRRVEIEAYERYLASLPRPPAIGVDFHAPCATDPHFIDCGTHDQAAPEFVRRLTRLVECVTRRCAERPRTALSAELTGPHPQWYAEGFERSAAGYLQANYGTLALILEAAYHAAGTGETVGPPQWRELGSAVALGVLDYVGRGGVK